MCNETIEEKVKQIFEEYNLCNVPNAYLQTIINVVKECHNVFKSNLINITLGGSCGKNDAIEGWSDVDIYIVLNSFDIKQMVEFNKGNFDTSLHVGITFYTIGEVENDLIDFKTRVMLFEKSQGKVNPVLYGIDVFREVEFDEIIKNDRLNFPNILHSYRRVLISIIKDEQLNFEYKNIKQLVLLLKMMLYREKIYVFGYEKTFKRFSEFCISRGLELPTIINFDIISVIKNLNNSKELLIEYSCELLQFIEESNFS